ncbi:hypothetical protein A2U01_0088624, partial [Trifolium medium]|nr:hypothetical protein [Trifolium medium]
SDMFKMINRNRLLSVMIKFQRDLLDRLDEAMRPCILQRRSRPP